MTIEHNLKERVSHQNFDLIAIYREVWQYRSFLANWTKRELELKYKGSLLGVVWSYLNPLLSLTIYFFVFSRIAKTGVSNYLVFLFVGITCWNFFSQVLSLSCTILTSSGGILSKVYFPQEILIISSITSAAVNYLISFMLVFLVVLWTKTPINSNILWFPIVFFIQCLFLYSNALLLSVFGVIIRDLGFIVTTLLGFLFFLTPIVYKPEAISIKYAWIISSQPFALIINAFRDIIYEGKPPNLKILLIFFICSCIWYIICHFVFHKLRYLVSDLL